MSDSRDWKNIKDALAYFKNKNKNKSTQPEPTTSNVSSEIPGEPDQAVDYQEDDDEDPLDFFNDLDDEFSLSQPSQHQSSIPSMPTKDDKSAKKFDFKATLANIRAKANLSFNGLSKDRVEMRDDNPGNNSEMDIKLSNGLGVERPLLNVWDSQLPPSAQRIPLPNPTSVFSKPLFPHSPPALLPPSPQLGRLAPSSPLTISDALTFTSKNEAIPNTMDQSRAQRLKEKVSSTGVLGISGNNDVKLTQSYYNKPTLDPKSIKDKYTNTAINRTNLTPNQIDPILSQQAQYIPNLQNFRNMDIEKSDNKTTSNLSDSKKGIMVSSQNHATMSNLQSLRDKFINPNTKRSNLNHEIKNSQSRDIISRGPMDKPSPSKPISRLQNIRDRITNQDPDRSNQNEPYSRSSNLSVRNPAKEPKSRDSVGNGNTGLTQDILASSRPNKAAISRSSTTSLAQTPSSIHDANLIDLDIPSKPQEQVQYKRPTPIKNSTISNLPVRPNPQQPSQYKRPVSKLPTARNPQSTQPFPIPQINTSAQPLKRPPGPAGFLSKRRKHGKFGLGPGGTELYYRNDDVFFEAGQWGKFLFEHNLPTYLPSNCHLFFDTEIDPLGGILTHSIQKIWNGSYRTTLKVPSIALVIKRVIDTETHAHILFADPTHEIQGSLHLDVFRKRPQLLETGTVIVIKNTSIVYLSPKEMFLNITMSNMVEAYPQPPANKVHNVNYEPIVFDENFFLSERTEYLNVTGIEMYSQSQTQSDPQNQPFSQLPYKNALEPQD